MKPLYQEKELIKEGSKFYPRWRRGTVDEEDIFFKLSEWDEKLLKYFDENPDFIMPASRKNEVISFVKSGLKDLSISRTSFEWGIKVENTNNHIMYVWIDALVNYLTSIDFPKTTKDQFNVLGKLHSYYRKRYFKIPCCLLACNVNGCRNFFT